MKTKLKRVSKSTLAVILAIMMVFSTMLVGTISVSAADGSFSAGDIIYIDFRHAATYNNSTSTGVNIYLNSDSEHVESCTPSWDDNSNRYIKSVSDYVAVKLSSDINFSAYDGSICKIGTYGWKELTNDKSNLPTGNQNMIVISYDGSNISYTWSTYDTSQKYYVIGSGANLAGWGNITNMEMTKQSDYYYFNVTSGSLIQFKIAEDASYKNERNANNNTGTKADHNTDIDIINSKGNFEIASQSSPYYILFYPEEEAYNSGNIGRVYASTTLPGSVTTHKASVTKASGAPNGASAYVSSYTDKDGNTQSGSSETATFKDGTDVTFTAAAVSGYTIAWSGADGTTGANGTTFTVSGATTDISVTATYTATTTTQNYYYSYYNGGNKYEKMEYDATKGLYYIYVHSGIVQTESDNYKFKITNNNNTSNQSANNSSECANYPIYDNTNNGADLLTSTYLTRSTSISSLNVSFDNYKNLQFPSSEYTIGDSSSNNQLVITFKPGTGGNALLGTIGLWTEADYDAQSTSGLKTPTITVPTSVQPGGEVKAVIANPKDYYTAASGPLEGLTFEYTVTSGDSVVDTTPSSSGKILNAAGTSAGINDTITFTASNTVNTTYTIRVKVTTTADATGVTSTNYTVKVQLVPNAQEGRIYAYAKDVTTGFQPDAWVAAEEDKAQQKIYKTKDEVNSNTTTYPTLGGTLATANDFRIFLPTTADKQKVVLYNNYSESITIFGETIAAYGCAEVTYTADTKTPFKVGSETKYITIYNSDAEAAIYVNYDGINSNNVPNMLTKLATKDDEIKSPTGAIADSNGVSTPTIKKIKGRGNTTWSDTDKKSFNITYKNSVNISGLTGTKFSLLANFKDPSLARNLITYEMADAMFSKNVYSPDCRTVDLYMDGMYMGSYLLCQKVEVGQGNLVNNIEEVKVDNITEVPAKFDFLIEVDSNATDAADFYFTSGSGQKITIKSPEYLEGDVKGYSADVSNAIKNYIKGKYDALYNVLNNPTSTKAELSAVIDLDSLARYYALNEFVKNFDVGVTSCYFNFDSSAGENGLFYASPVWDYDVSTGNVDKGEDYTKADGDWTINKDRANTNIMRSVANNANVQAAVRAIWTTEFYSKLITWLNSEEGILGDTLTLTARNNFVKWSSPAGSNIGTWSETVSLKTSFSSYDYDVSSHSVTPSNTKNYNGLPQQVDFVFDWLRTRAAWLTQKYNTYYITGFGDWETSNRTMTNSNGINTYELTGLSANTPYDFKICSDGAGNRDSNAFSISYCPDINYSSTTANVSVNEFDSNSRNFSFTTSGSLTSDSKVYITYNQKNNTVTLSDQISTTTNPSVTLSGSTVKNEDIIAGTSVTLTATVTPATKDGVVLTGDYTVDLYRDGSKVSGQSKTVTFDAESSATQSVTFTTALVGTSQSYTVKVSYTDSEGTTLTADSAAVPYNQTGLKDQKIYFDPSTQYTGEGADKTQIWKSVMTTTSTVTATLNDGETFIMSIDTDDIHGYDKGVFVANITSDTLAKLQNPSNTVTFALDNSDLTTPAINGNASIQSGWIYNYSNETGQELWEAYNVAYDVKYPKDTIKSYDDFKTHLAGQVSNDTDNIIYFDNSASKWYNVYLYTWDAEGNYENCVQMTKLPYADIWYYDFGRSMRTERFLFKDRSDKGFGSDFQQTVDLVDGSVDTVSGKIDIKFTTAINRAQNPIFITDKFEKITENGGSGALKFRAFNTQWQEFNDVVINEVQTKAVDIYFDLHGNASTNPDTMSIYHESLTDKYKFSSESTTLTKLPGSTIYYARLNLPYTDAGLLKFKFTKFVAGSIEKTMGDKAQPAFTCINTGEVWYEYAPSGISYKTTPAEATVLSAKPADDSPSVGANETNDSVAANTITVYFAPGNSSNTWENSNTDLTGRTFKCNVQGGDKDSNKWWSVDMVDTGKTIDSNKVYSATITYNDTGLFNMQFQKFNNSSFENQVVPIKNVWTNTDTMNGKFWNGSSWTDPNWDTVSTTGYYLLGGLNTNGGTDNWDGKDKSTPISTKVSDTVYSAEIKATGNDIYFNIGDGSTRYGSDKNGPDEDMSSHTTQESAYTTTSTTGSNGTALKIPSSWNGDYILYVEISGTTPKVWITPKSSPTPSIKLTAENTTLTLSNGSASTKLTVTTDNAGSPTVNYSVTKGGASVDANIASVNESTKVFTATEAGTYEVTAKITVGDVDYSATVTITVNSGSVSTTEYCGVLGYNHSTATFASTAGGKITEAYVNLKGGYYQASAIPTGYTTVTDGVYTVIYALTSTGKTDATTENVGTTAKADSSSKYQFNGWLKDNQPILGTGDNQILEYSEEVSGTSTVEYVASWSELLDKIYKFTYKYRDYNKAEYGIEYVGTAGTVDEALTLLNSAYTTYTINVNLPGDATETDVKNAYISRAPKLQSDYFIYSFDINGVTVYEDNLTAEAVANLDSVKKYIVTLTDDYTQKANVFYQNIVTLTVSNEDKASLTSGKTLKWTDSYGNTLFIGNTYTFRVTKDVTVSYKIIDKTETINSTYVNEPTYEFYTTNTGVEKIRFNIRVDNIVDSNSNVTEYGIIRFYTDENGKPLDSTIAQDENISSDTLKSLVAAGGSASVTVYMIKDSVINQDKKYIYAPSMTNNTANKDKNVRVFSYFKIKNSDDTETIVVSDNSVILSINKAISA